MNSGIACSKALGGRLETARLLASLGQKNTKNQQENPREVSCQRRFYLYFTFLNTTSILSQWFGFPWFLFKQDAEWYVHVHTHDDM